MINMYRGRSSKVTENEYLLMKMFFMEENRNINIEHNLVRELRFKNNKEFVVRMNQMNEDEIYIIKSSNWNGITNTASEKITKEECVKLINGDISWMNDTDRLIVNNLYLQILYNGIRIGEVNEFMEESCLDVDSEQTTIFTYGREWSKMNFEMFFDASAKFKYRNNSIIADVHTYVAGNEIMANLVSACTN